MSSYGGSMENLELFQALEPARVEVQLLANSAERSRAHKQRCRDLSHAASLVLKQIETAAFQRTLDHAALLTTAARLQTATKSARERVDALGNPGALARLTKTFNRKLAERILSDEGRSIMDLLSYLLPGVGRGRDSHPLPLPERPRPRDAGVDWLLSPTTPGTIATPDNLSVGGGFSPSAIRQPLALTMGRGTSSGSLASPPAGVDDVDLPFGQRTVRSSDNNPVQRLCFMRAAGTDMAVQLMVALPKQVEVYSAALESFHSDTPLEKEEQQATSTVLYEPTIDLITGHRDGSVLVYGREGWGLSAASASPGSATAAAVSAATQAGVPLVIRLSRTAVTALHCVPAIELEVASETIGGATAAAAAAAAAGNKGAADGPPAPAPAPAAGTAAPTPGSTGSCPIDDVLLFTGDALGRVMAVRYSRMQSEVLAATVFTAARRTQSDRNLAQSSLDSISPEISGLLYRSGYLLVSTASDSMFLIRVTRTTPPAAAAANAAPTSTGEAAAPLQPTAAGGGASPGADAPAASTTAPPGTPGTPTSPNPTTLPPSTSVNLLSPAVSAMPGVAPQPAAAAAGAGGSATATASGGNDANAVNTQAGAGGGGGANGGGPSTSGAANGAGNTPAGGGTGSPPAGPTGGGTDNNNNNDNNNSNSRSIIRRGTLHLATHVVDSFSFHGFGGCTALVALDWGQPAASSSGGAAAADAPTSPSTVAAAVTANFFPAMTEPRGTAATTAAAAGLPPNAPTSSDPARTVTPRRGSWRMLSAHTIGQLLMWDLTAGRLHLICAIGNPGPPIVHVCLFPSLAMMVELLASGEIRMGPLPSSSLAPPLTPLGGVPVWRLGHARIRAHRSRITAAASLQNCIATGSKAGGVKVWDAAQLRMQAAKQGVSFLSVPAAAGNVAAVRGAAVAAGGPGGSQAGAGSSCNPRGLAVVTPTISTTSAAAYPFGLMGADGVGGEHRSGLATPNVPPSQLLDRGLSMRRNPSAPPTMYPPLHSPSVPFVRQQSERMCGSMGIGNPPALPYPDQYGNGGMFAQPSYPSNGGAPATMMVPGPQNVGGGAGAGPSTGGVLHAAALGVGIQGSLDSPHDSIKPPRSKDTGRPTSEDDGMSEESSLLPSNSVAVHPLSGKPPSSRPQPQEKATSDVEKVVERFFTGGHDGDSPCELPHIPPVGNPTGPASEITERPLPSPTRSQRGMLPESRAHLPEGGVSTFRSKWGDPLEAQQGMATQMALRMDSLRRSRPGTPSPLPVPVPGSPGRVMGVPGSPRRATAAAPGAPYGGPYPLSGAAGPYPDMPSGYASVSAFAAPPSPNQTQHVPGPAGCPPSRGEWWAPNSPKRGQGALDVMAPPPIPVLPPPPPIKPSGTTINPLLQFIPTNDLRLLDPIGQGAEGTVWRGRWHHIDVAVKEMHPTSDSFGKLVSIAKDLSCPESAHSSEVVASVVKEVSALIKLSQHPNVIRFVGVCIAPPRIVTEYYKNGSLFTMLKEARQGNIRTREKLTWDKRLIMLQDIAAGMAYLHSRNYIHGDLRSPNVFVTEDQRLKIGDFGFARILGNAGEPARFTNPRWQAPEVYDLDNPTATTAADVYSFAIIMYEMLTFRLPYDEVSDDGVVKCRHMFNPSWRPSLPEDRKLPVPRNIHLQAFKTLMMDCWAEDPAVRPPFHKVAERLMALIRWENVLRYVRIIVKSTPSRNPQRTNSTVTSHHEDEASSSRSITEPPLSPRSTADTVVAEDVAALGAGLTQVLTELATSLHHDPVLDRQLLDAMHREALAVATAPPVAVPPQAAPAAAVPSPAPAAAVPAQEQATTAAALAADSLRTINARAGASRAASLTPPDTEPQLESVPTLASTNSRPLVVSAASISQRSSLAPPPAQPLQILASLPSLPQQQTSPTALTALQHRPPLGAASAPAPAPTVAVMGAGPDGFGMLSPFKDIRSLSDDEEEDAAPVVPVRTVVPPPPPPAPPAVACPLPTAAAPPARPPVDPFSMASPFHDINSLDSDEDEEAGRSANVAANGPLLETVVRRTAAPSPALPNGLHGAGPAAAAVPNGLVANGPAPNGLVAPPDLPSVSSSALPTVGLQLARSESSVGLPPPPLQAAAAIAAGAPRPLPGATAPLVRPPVAAATPARAAAAAPPAEPAALGVQPPELAAAMSATSLVPVTSLARVESVASPLGAGAQSLGARTDDPFTMLSPFSDLKLDVDDDE